MKSTRFLLSESQKRKSMLHCRSTLLDKKIKWWEAELGGEKKVVKWNEMEQLIIGQQITICAAERNKGFETLEGKSGRLWWGWTENSAKSYWSKLEKLKKYR